MKIDFEEKCGELLMLLADQTGRNLSPFVVEFYLERLGPDYENACFALSRLAESVKTFPTVAEIKAEADGGAITDDGIARETAARIFSAVGKFGEIWGSGEESAHLRLEKEAKIKAFVGEIGWEIVQMQGGWNLICNVLTNDNASTHLAQWRELAKHQRTKHKHAQRALNAGCPRTALLEESN